MRIPKVVKRIFGGVKKIKRLAKNRPPKRDADPIWTPEQSVGVCVNDGADNKPSQRSYFRLRKKDVIRAVRRIRNRPYSEFDSKRVQKKRVRFELPDDAKPTRESRKQKRKRAFRRFAKRAVEYLALGVASSAPGYGMPPGFNPNAFRSANKQHEYPETYSLQQLRWIAQQKRDLYSLGTIGIV